MSAPAVNSHPQRRAYDGAGRRALSAERRQALLAAARQHFLDGGFTGTTVAAVASDAGVSPESVYKWFGSKAGLLRGVWEQALEGSGPTHAEARSDAASGAATSAREIIANWARLSAEVGAVGDRIRLLIQGAASVDAEAGALHTEIEAARARRMEHNVAYLVDGGFLRADVSPEQARDVLLLHTTFYESLVTRAGWSTEEFIAFIERGLTAHLLP